MDEYLDGIDGTKSGTPLSVFCVALEVQIVFFNCICVP